MIEQARIAETGIEHRLVESVVAVFAVDGTPLADTELTVEQTCHAFGFGNIGFDLVDLANGEEEDRPAAENLARLWLDLFNTATLPFYWANFEPERGSPRTARLKAAARWFAARAVVLKGHPLTWHTLAPAWLRDLPVAEIEAVLRDRIRREVSGFAGYIDTWDAVNEAVIAPVFDKEENGITRLTQAIGRVPVLRLAFEEARAANPRARLLLNDFDLSADYERLIEEALETGVRIDAIGLQTHMHQGYRGEDHVFGVVDRFARFGLPIHLTETSLVSGELMRADIVDLNDFEVEDWPSTPEGEERQADELARHYRSLVGHPAVEAITYWGITDKGAWLGAPVGLVRADGTPKPSYAALHELIKGRWWLPPTQLRTDRDGRFVVRGFAGDYCVRVDGAATPFSLESSGEQRVTLSSGPH